MCRRKIDLMKRANRFQSVFPHIHKQHMSPQCCLWPFINYITMTRGGGGGGGGISSVTMYRDNA